MTRDKKVQNPLLGKNIPQPPVEQAPITTPQEPASDTRKQEEATDENQEQATETKITIVLNRTQEDKLIGLKVEYQRLHRKWLSDTELIRRLIESSTLENILVPSDQVRNKQKKREKIPYS